MAGPSRGLVVEVVPEPDLAGELGQVALAVPPYQFLKGHVDELAFSADPGEQKRLLHESVVQHDVGSQWDLFSVLVYRSVYCTQTSAGR